MSHVLAAMLLASAILTPAVADATVLTFDTLAPDSREIPGGYAGLVWNNMFTVNPDTNEAFEGSSYANGRKSLSNVAYNSGGDAATVLAGAQPFTLDDGYFTAAWNNGLTLTVEGFVGGSVAAFTRTVTLNVAGPSLLSFGWTGLTAVRFLSSGGTEAPGVKGQGTQFVLDNLRVNTSIGAAVPEPATWGMMILGSVMIGVGHRRRHARVIVARAA